MTSYIPTIGLEIHAELKTKTKMFCDSQNDSGETRPNVNVCPVCMGHPGTLPVINKEAVKHVLKVGVAVGGTFAGITEFDRKNYFYPDIPKGYQISQYQNPLVSGGELDGVAITRIHLEEDTATSQHLTIDDLQLTEDSRSKVKGQRSDVSLIDFNRAGVPLMELVTEPVIHDAKKAGNFARELQLLLRCLGASDANMEKGEMRIEANISVARAPEIADSRGLNADSRRSRTPRSSASSRRSSAAPLGIKVEVKNLNSFKAVERAIEYEVRRQSECLERGEEVLQETRGWNEDAGHTFSQRRKEESHDYRYFPEPDLPALRLSEIPVFAASRLKKELPELPSEKRARYLREGIAPPAADMFVGDARYGTLFEETAAQMKASGASTATLAANYISTDIAGLVLRRGEAGLAHITAKGLSACLSRVAARDISSRGAKDAIAEVFEKGGDLAEISKKYIQQSNAGELQKIVESVVRENPKVVSDYKNGKSVALQFLVGQGMKATRGSANPELLRELLRKAIR